MRKKASSTTPINAGLVLAIVKGARKKVEARDPDEWWKTSEGIDAKGKELGLKAEVSESYQAFKTRIFNELRKRKEIEQMTQEKSNAI